MRLLPLIVFAAGCSASGGLPEDLLARLRDPQESVRDSAIWDLQEMRTPDAAPHLIAALRDPSVQVRVSAAMVLKDAEGRDVVAALGRACKDPEEQVREWAVIALGKIADPAGLPALREAGGDPSARVRDSASQAVAAIESAIQAKDVRYHPPASVPDQYRGPDRATYLKAHEQEWTFVVSRTVPTEMTEVRLTVGAVTICEAPPIDTAGAYAGQNDALNFLRALQRRCAKDPKGIDEFRALREACLKRHPPKPAGDDEK